MLMPKKNRIAIYELLFKEGVMVAKKDVHMPKHPELADKNVPNLHVMKAMQVGYWSSVGWVVPHLSQISGNAIISGSVFAQLLKKKVNMRKKIIRCKK